MRVSQQLPKDGSELPLNTHTPRMPGTTGSSKPHHSLRERTVRLLRKRLLGDEELRLRDALRARLLRPATVRLKDQVAYVLGIVNVLVAQGVLLVAPGSFGSFYAWWAPALFVWRVVSYTQQRWYMFLLDFCYAVNALSAALLIFPAVPSAVFWMAYVDAVGPVILAVLAWRNSLVFHDLEKMTTLFIHVAPALLLFALRWFHVAPSGLPFCDTRAENQSFWSTVVWRDELWVRPANAAAPCEPIPEPFELLGWGVLYYAAWQGVHLLITETECLCGRRLRTDPSLDTSMRWLGRDRRGFMNQTTHRVCRFLGVIGPDDLLDPESAFGKAVFITGQLLITVAAQIPAVLAASSPDIGLAWIALMLLCAAWNGSSFYFEIFARRYAASLDEAEEKRTT